MIKSILVILVILFSSNVMILDSYQTHISAPIITSDQFSYKAGEDIIISGWVNYNDEPTSDVLLRVTATNPNGIKIFDEYTISNTNGEFSISIPIPVDEQTGNYFLQVISQCREIHRQVCTHQYESLSISVEGVPNQNTIPEWIKNNVKWWADGIIDDKQFVGGIEFLINQGILVVPPTAISDDQSDEIPDWIKNNGKWWAEGIISDDEFLNNIQFLIANGILSVSSVLDSELQTFAGKFNDADFVHRVSGTASIEFTPDRGGTLHFDENFETTHGPDLHVYLATDTSANDFVSVGQIESFGGEQSYSISSDVDLEKYDNVLIWCEAFSMLFGHAELK
ncbi:MAG: hypothetical protein EA447_01765 [Nitrosopumilus sp.]|nr:MAG: hypothetical protein EA447_01765 [Nitrosopumilus sp.]